MGTYSFDYHFGYATLEVPQPAFESLEGDHEVIGLGAPERWDGLCQHGCANDVGCDRVAGRSYPKPSNSSIVWSPDPSIITVLP